MTDQTTHFSRARRGPRKRPKQRKATALGVSVGVVEEISSPSSASEASTATEKRRPVPLRRKSNTMPTKSTASTTAASSPLRESKGLGETPQSAPVPRVAPKAPEPERKAEKKPERQRPPSKAREGKKEERPSLSKALGKPPARPKDVELHARPSAEVKTPAVAGRQRKPIRNAARKIQEDGGNETLQHEFKRGGEVGARPSMSLDVSGRDRRSYGYLRRVLMYTDSKLHIRSARNGRTRETRFAPFVLDSQGRAIPVRCSQKDYILIDAHCDCTLNKFVQYLFLHLAEFDEITLIDESSLSQHFDDAHPYGLRLKALDQRVGKRKLSEALTPASEAAGPNHAHEIVAYVTVYLARLHGIPWEVNNFCYPLICSITQPGKSGLYPNIKDVLYSYLCIVKLICTYGRRSALPKRVPERMRDIAMEMVGALNLKMPKLRQAGVSALVGLYLSSRCRRPQMTPTADVQHGIAHLLTPLYAFIHGKFKLSGDLDDIAAEIPGLRCNISKHNLAKILCVFPFKKARTYDFIRVYRSLQSAQRVSFWSRASIIPRGGFRWSTKVLERAMRGSPDFVNSVGRNAEGSRDIVVYTSSVKDLSADLYMMIQVLRRKAGRHYVYLWDADGYSDTRAEISFMYRRSRRMQVLDVSPIPDMQGWMHTRKFSGAIYHL